MQVGVGADDLRGVLVGADGAVGTEPVEHGAHLGVVGAEVGVRHEAEVGDVVDDADREAVQWRVLRGLVEHGLHHRRRELLAAEAVATTEHTRGATIGPLIGAAVPQAGQHVEVERLERRAGLLGAVEDCDGAHARRQRREQRLGGERPVQPDECHADALAGGVHRIDGFTYGAGARPHDHDHAVGIGRTVVVDEVVFTSAQLGELVHRGLDGTRHAGVERVARLARLEEHVGVLGRPADDRAVRIEPAAAVLEHTLFADQFAQLLG